MKKKLIGATATAFALTTLPLMAMAAATADTNGVTVTVNGQAPKPSGWYNTDNDSVQVSAPAGDTVSLTVGNQTATGSSATVTVQGDGTHTVTYTVTDANGGIVENGSLPVNIETKGYEARIAFNPGDGNVEVTMIAPSGQVGKPPFVGSIDPNAPTFPDNTVTVTDNAGNSITLDILSDNKGTGWQAHINAITYKGAITKSVSPAKNTLQLESDQPTGFQELGQQAGVAPTGVGDGVLLQALYTKPSGTTLLFDTDAAQLSANPSSAAPAIVKGLDILYLQTNSGNVVAGDTLGQAGKGTIPPTLPSAKLPGL
jgi:hypothetical protein